MFVALVLLFSASLILRNPLQFWADGESISTMLEKISPSGIPLSRVYIVQLCFRHVGVYSVCVPKSVLYGGYLK